MTEPADKIRIAINIDVMPGVAGGIAQSTQGLVSSLGQLDGPEQYVLSAQTPEQAEWISAYRGPNQQIVCRRARVADGTSISEWQPHRLKRRSPAGSKRCRTSGRTSIATPTMAGTGRVRRLLREPRVRCPAFPDPVIHPCARCRRSTTRTICSTCIIRSSARHGSWRGAKPSIERRANSQIRS